MGKTWAFDSPEALRINKNRSEFLDRLLPDLIKNYNLQTALDTGCGLGYFSQHLSELGLKTTAFDARKENVTEARARYPHIRFAVADVEDPGVQELGLFDVVLSYGLLYHLENPFRAIRNLCGLTNKILVIESMVIPQRRAAAALIDEGPGEDQALRYIALVPSEACIVKALCRAGFALVYKATWLPDHEDFRTAFGRARRRTILVASKVEIASPLLQPVSERRELLSVWQEKSWYRWLRWGKRRLRTIKRLRDLPTRARVRRLRRKLARKPVLMTLPSGIRWLAQDDVLSLSLCLKTPFEEGERTFVNDYLQPGMVVFDIGAHHGLYTLLASKKVGSGGLVVAFEPSNRELEKLRQHLSLNNCTNVRVEQSAVSSNVGTASLFVCLGQETGLNSLHPPVTKEPTQCETVSTVTLDGYASRNKIKHVDLIKIDVEGAELDVIKGAAAMLNSRPAPVVIIEAQDMRTGPWGYRAREIREFMEGCHYLCFTVSQQGRLRACPSKEQYNENLIFIPESMQARLHHHIDSGRFCGRR